MSISRVSVQPNLSFGVVSIEREATKVQVYVFDWVEALQLRWRMSATTAAEHRERERTVCGKTKHAPSWNPFRASISLWKEAVLERWSFCVICVEWGVGVFVWYMCCVAFRLVSSLRVNVCFVFVFMRLCDRSRRGKERNGKGSLYIGVVYVVYCSDVLSSFEIQMEK